MLTIKELAEELKVSRQTIYVWCKKGIIKPVKIGTRLRFTKEELERIKRGETNEM